MIAKAVLIFGFFLGFVQIAFAQQNAPLEAAAELWLAGEDEQSLAQLAALAQAGNPDARLLLGRIETEDLGFSAYRKSLDGKASRSLFRRSTGSPLGQTWLSAEAAAGNALAKALLEAKKPVPNLQVIQRLSALGEREATDHATRILALYGEPEMKEALRNSPVLLDDLKPYIDYLSGQPEPRGDGLAALRHMAPAQSENIRATDPETMQMANLLALGLGFGDHTASNPWRPTVETWLMSAPSARPIANLCRRHCAADAPQCAFAFMALSGGYYEVIRYDSPLERVIPQEDFLKSMRAQRMVLGRAVLARTETNLKWLSDLHQLPEISQCAANLTTQARSEYE